MVNQKDHHSKNSNHSRQSPQESPTTNSLPETMNNFSKLHLSFQTDVNKRNCLHLAALYDCSGFIRIFTLMVSYAEIQELMLSQDFEGETPFHIACRTGHVQVVETFLQIFEIFREVNFHIPMNDEQIGNLTCVVNSSNSSSQRRQHLRNHSKDSNHHSLILDPTLLFFQIKNKKGETPLHSAVSSLIEVHQNLKNAAKLNANILDSSSQQQRKQHSQQQLDGDFLNIQPLKQQTTKRKKTFLEISHKHKKRNLRKIISKLIDDSRVDVHSKNNVGKSIHDDLREFTDYFDNSKCEPTVSNSSLHVASPSSIMILSGSRSSIKFFSKPLFSISSKGHYVEKSATTSRSMKAR